MLYWRAMAIYHDYADIYDLIGQGAFAEGLAHALLAEAERPPQRVLDLACGAGAATLVFAAAGCRVVGIDRAPRMLAIARARARDRGLSLELIEGDVRRLHAFAHPGLQPADFDLVTCFYDSLNYLLDDHDLVDLFCAVRALLRPGGRLVCDLNSPAEFAAWDDSYQVIYDDDSLLVYNQLSYDQARWLGQGRIVWFRREYDRWWRNEELHEERAWRVDEVCAALATAGLQLRTMRTADGAPADEESRRIVYLAEAPH